MNERILMSKIANLLALASSTEGMGTLIKAIAPKPQRLKRDTTKLDAAEAVKLIAAQAKRERRGRQ